jgi:hypothetical protein
MVVEMTRTAWNGRAAKKNRFRLRGLVKKLVFGFWIMVLISDQNISTVLNGCQGRNFRCYLQLKTNPRLELNAGDLSKSQKSRK